MEIAFFTDSYEPMHDGVASVTGGLARALVALGHGVRVYAPDTRVGAPSRDDVEAGVRVRRIRSVPVPLYPQYRWPVFPFGLAHGAREARNADVIHLHSPGAVGSMGFLLARGYRRPLVGTFHTNLHEMGSSVPRKLLVPLFFRIAWWYNLGTYWRCDVTTAPSEAARDELVRCARKPFRRPIEVIGNGVDVRRFRPGVAVPDWRARCGLPSGALVTYLGRLTVDKGIHRFLDAVGLAARTTDVVGIVGGTGPEEASVRSRLADDPRLRARVRYVGPIAEVEKTALLGQTDVFVLPSTSDTSSVALLEAMACGTPVVAPATGGASEVVDDGVTGVRANVVAAADLATALVGLIERPADRRRIGAHASAWVRDHASLESVAQRFISLYRMVSEERPSRGDRFAA